MRNSLASLALLALFLVTAHAQSAEYYWADYPGNPPHASSAEAYCRAWAQRVGTYQGYPVSYLRHEMVGEVAASCYATYANDRTLVLGSTYRHGNECPEGSEYNAADGSCKGLPTCSDKVGQSFPFSRTGTAGDGELIWNIGVGGAAGDNWSLNSQDACNDGCAATVVRSKCAVRVSGSYVCGGTAEYTGAACPASTSGPVQPEPSESLPEPKTDQVNQPCIYETLPDGTQRCRSVTATDTEGQICGEFNGSRVCTSRQPKTDGTTIDTTVRTETNPDGSKTITKTDTATKEVCVGAGACSSTTTTTTTTTHVDANGNKTGESSTCTGSACPSAGNPDGDGDGIGDCTGDDCGDGGVPGLDDVPGFGDALRGYLDGVSDAPIVKALNGIGLSGQGSCHFPSVTVAYLGTLSFDVICHHAGWLDPLYPLMLAVYAFLAIRLFFTA